MSAIIRNLEKSNLINKSQKRSLVDSVAIEKNVKKLINYLNPIILNIDNIKGILKPDIKYIVQIPKEILDKIVSGEFDFMRSNGEIIANVVDKTRPKNPVVKQLRMSIENLSNPQANFAVGQMIQNIAIQQQLAVITEKLDDIACKAEKILTGQMTDRLGFIYGSWDTYQQALCISDKNLSNVLKREVIQSLNIGRQQLLQYIYSQEKFFKKLPKKNIDAFMRNLNGKLIKDCGDVLNSSNQALTGIALSTVLLSNIYLSYDEINVLEVLAKPLSEMVEICREDFLLTADIAGKQEIPYGWVINPNETEKFLDVIKNPIKMFKNQDVIDIEISGTELMELKEENYND